MATRVAVSGMRFCSSSAVLEEKTYSRRLQRVDVDATRIDGDTAVSRHRQQSPSHESIRNVVRNISVYYGSPTPRYTPKVTLRLSFFCATSSSRAWRSYIQKPFLLLSTAYHHGISPPNVASWGSGKGSVSGGSMVGKRGRGKQEGA